MKKTILSMLLAVVAVGVNAQTSKEIPAFELIPTGSFVAPDGKDYIVYPVDGKSAHELFQMVCTNAGKVYNSPKNVMSVVEDKSVAIRALSEEMVVANKMFGLYNFYNSYYNLLFEFKDGRIKVAAPNIGSMWLGTKSADFSRVARKLFDKDLKVKENRKEWKMLTETKINIIINLLLGTTDKETNEDDW